MNTKTKKPKTPPPVLAYKGFNGDWVCNGHQYKVGESYEHPGPIKVCSSGFHSCSYPMDVWRYYDVIGSKFAIVEVSGEQETHNEDSKICSSKLHVKAEISIAEMIKASVDWHFNGWWKKAKKDGKLASDKPLTKMAASGNYTKMAASGNYTNMAASGNYTKMAASGYGTKMAASGNYTNMAASGDDTKMAASGYGTKMAASGGGTNVIVSAERDVVIKGSLGTFVCLTHYVDGKPIGMTTGQIGKKGLKPDTWYGLDADGKFKEQE